MFTLLGAGPNFIVPEVGFFFLTEDPYHKVRTKLILLIMKKSSVYSFNVYSNLLMTNLYQKCQI